MSKPVPLEYIKAQDWDGAKRIAIASFLGVLSDAEKIGLLDDKDNFSRFLNDSLTRFDLSASKLAAEEKISKAAVSKWMNSHAMPSPPTRKTIINWVRSNLQNQLDDLMKNVNHPERPNTKEPQKKNHLNIA